MGLRKHFKTDDNSEQEGIVVEYDGETRITIARAGGANTDYEKELTRRTKRYRAQIRNGTIDNKTAESISREVFAKCVVKGWQTKVGDKFKSGIVPEDAGEKGDALLPVNEKNILKVFNELPDLYDDLSSQASDHTVFLMQEDATDLKNS